jgi:hypothetical protein
MLSADQIVPELRNLRVGEVSMRPNDAGMRVEALDRW